MYLPSSSHSIAPFKYTYCIEGLFFDKSVSSNRACWASTNHSYTAFRFPHGAVAYVST